MAERWGIVGGGMLGMTLALRLAQRGADVTLLEAAPRLGGLADAWQLGPITWDRHYHVTLLSDTRQRAVLDELDLDDEIEWVVTKTGFYTDGRLHSLSNSWEFLSFPPLSMVDKFRLGATIFHASKIRDWRRLEQIPVADWLERWSGRRTFERIWLPLLRAKLGENYTKTSAAFIWATIARMYAARRSGMKREMFGYVPGGYGRIIEALERKLVDLGVHVRKGAAVGRVTRGESELEVALGDGESLGFDRVVCTTPSPVIAGCCSQLAEEEIERLQAVDHQGVVCMSLLLERPLSEFYVTNITDPGCPFTGVIEMTTLVDPATFGGHSLVYLPKYVPSDHPTFERSDEDLREEFVGALESMYPHFSESQVLECRISRVRHVMAIPALDYSRRAPGHVTSVPGLYVVNSAQIFNSTLNVNETVRLAEETLETVLIPNSQSLSRYDEATADRQLVARP